MFSLLAHLSRFKRDHASLFLLTALLALWAMPMTGQAASPQSNHAILWLLATEARAPQTQHLGAQTSVETQDTSRDETPIVSKATAHFGSFQVASSPTTPRKISARATHDLSATVIARLSGIQTNVRLN